MGSGALAGRRCAPPTTCVSYALGPPYLFLLRLHPREQIRWLEPALQAARRLKNRWSEAAALGNLGNAYNWASIAGPSSSTSRARHRAGDRRPRGEGNALGSLGNAYNSLGEYPRAIEFHEQRLAIAREIGNRLEESNMLGNLGNAYDSLGEYRRAIELRAEPCYRTEHATDWSGQVTRQSGQYHCSLGEYHQAIEFYEQGLAIAREIGDRLGEGTALGNLGSAYCSLGEYRRAIEFYEQGLAIAREIGDRRGEGTTLWNMSLSLDKLGERAQAIANAQAALDIFEQIEPPTPTRCAGNWPSGRRVPDRPDPPQNTQNCLLTTPRERGILSCERLFPGANPCRKPRPNHNNKT